MNAVKVTDKVFYTTLLDSFSYLNHDECMTIVNNAKKIINGEWYKIGKIGLDKEDLTFCFWKSLVEIKNRYKIKNFLELKKCINFIYKRRLLDYIRKFNRKKDIPIQQAIQNFSYQNDYDAYAYKIDEETAKKDDLEEKMILKIFIKEYLEREKSKLKKETLKLILQGESRKDIANKLLISTKTIKSYWDEFIAFAKELFKFKK
ncbi:LuxR C-terminal-related transcriptional regulator [Spiroplasma endosymbiont of Crioceris asparagi]|uniref:LuxR C-terminal-related transcriptional regulator n=1 Tax=Spiroplasma endosymbiont of Crioceris asparagi TaxID=3066286 RepID=UPI0030D49423